MAYYHTLFRQAHEILGERTPLPEDCGTLCGKACCRGDHTQGMRLFPHETTALPQTVTADGGRLVTCSGTCNREVRPLACRIFPLFPFLHEDGHITAEIDARGMRLCPLVAHAEQVRFDPEFIRAVRKVGRILAQDPELYAFLRESSAEIETFRMFFDFHARPSMRTCGRK